jgi:hypothetical protein
MRLLTPLLFLPVLLFAGAARFSAGAAAAMLPYLPLLGHAAAMKRNLLDYVPTAQNWGAMFLLSSFPAISGWYWAHGRLVLLAGMVVLIFRSRHKISTASAVCLWLILTPGFGPQYLIYPAALLAALPDRTPAVLWSVTAGGFLILVYAAGFHLDQRTSWIEPFAGSALAFGMLAWAVLVNSLPRKTHQRL